MSVTKENIQASVAWLKENYRHIWNNTDLNVSEKAGFLAACCDSRRCCLTTLDLRTRVTVILNGLVLDGKDG